jgi:AAA+ ATPase superfamily predicted ATPase
MKAINAIFACMLSVSVPTFAESNFNPSINIDLQTRVSYLNDRIDNHIRHDASGFKGDYFLLSVSGQVTDRLTYSWRQRINQKKERSDWFDGTDWVYLDYKLDDHWSVAAGKQVAMVGGYEYDRNPVDIYVSSEFWNNIAPFQFGASATYTTTNGKNRFTAQVTQSLFNTPDDLLCLYMITGGVAKYIELLIDAKCYTKEKMLNYICRQDSYFITEGKDLLNQEFSSEHGTYFSILQIIASGKTKRSEIDRALQKDVGTFLQNLESKYELIRRKKPLLAKQNSKVSTYEIRDNFLRFWFRFIYPFQSLIERQLFAPLRSNISNHYEDYSGRVLEQYFHDKVMESGQYTQVGNWWDRKGQNEIDLIAINEFDHTGIIAEVKRNPKKINLQKLAEKAAALPSKDFAPYHLQPHPLSLTDM